MQNKFLTRPFEIIQPGLAVGQPALPGWEPISQQALLILVGLSSVGKTSLLEALRSHGLAYSLLPDRRILVDQLIITQLQIALGETVRPVNRYERYPYMHRYREQFPGGMGHALAQLLVQPQQPNELWLFNGLRGENEVGYALDALPQARFVVLQAPDLVRLRRMLIRNDPHDKVNNPGASQLTATLESFDELDVPEASKLFNSEQQQTLLEMVRQGEVTAQDLRDKLLILVEERHSYDPVATEHILMRLAPQRTLVIDTTNHTPDQIAQAIIQKLN